MSGTSVYRVAAELRTRMPGIGVKKLHKLLYYCQGHHLGTFGRPLFPESISAWDMGPMAGTLWHAEKEAPSNRVRRSPTRRSSTPLGMSSAATAT